MTRIAIDLNVRVRGNETYAGFEDVEGPLPSHHGELVEVYERESGASGKAEVRDIDNERRLIFLAVDWAGLTEHIMSIPGMTDEPGMLTRMYAVTEAHALPQS